MQIVLKLEKNRSVARHLDSMSISVSSWCICAFPAAQFLKTRECLADDMMTATTDPYMRSSVPPDVRVA